ncbi:Uncharacterised protein [Vibrio cholerae]|nr:Uncharacterised protein [Vibrio cholerae]CSC77322.1 Uncharacterised protein [Vibrio cholerae]
MEISSTDKEDVLMYEIASRRNSASTVASSCWHCWLLAYSLPAKRFSRISVKRSALMVRPNSL